MALSANYRSIMNGALSAFDQETKAAQAQENMYKQQYGTERDRGLRDSYVNYMQGKRDLPQMLSYMGYSGGPAETSMLKLNTSYEQGRQDKENSYLDAIKELTTKYMGTYADINSRRAQAQSQYEAMIAQAVAEEQAAAAAVASRSYGGYSRSGGYSGYGDDDTIPDPPSGPQTMKHGKIPVKPATFNGQYYLQNSYNPSSRGGR